MKIYLSVKGEIYGPYTRSNIEKFAKESSVSLDTLTFTKGSNQWIPLGELLKNMQSAENPDPNENDIEPIKENLDSEKKQIVESGQASSSQNADFITETVDKIKDLIVSDEIQFSIDLLRGLKEGREEICMGILEGVEKDYEGAMEYPNWIDYEPSRMVALYVALSMLKNCKRAEKLFRQITYANLHGANLKELPRELYDLYFLEKMSLEQNELKDLPEGIGHLKKMTSLELGYNKFKNLPKCLSELYNLQNLDLSGNKLKKNKDFWDELNQLEYLKHIDLGGNSFATYPEDLSSMKRLEKIKLSGVSLKKEKLAMMLQGLASLPQLSELDISNCEISKIPDEIIELKNLKSLDLSNNKFKEFPLKLNKLNRLESFSLYGNPVLEERENEQHEDFPIFEEKDGIGSLSDIPEWEEPERTVLFGRSRELLDEFEESFEYGGVNRIDAAIDNILEHDDPTLLSEVVRGCTLNVDGYFMTGSHFPFPSWIESVFVPNYIEENPSENWKGPPFSSDDDRMDAALPYYALLRILPYLPQDDRIHPSLFIKNIKRLFLVLPERIPSEIGCYSELEELALPRNGLVFIPSKIGDLTKLRSLNVNNNQLTELPPTMAKLKELRHLALNENSIYELPDWIGELNELRILDFACNKIKEMPSSIDGLTNLKFLGLRDNKLTALPPTIGQLKNLMHLWLGGNRIESLPEELYEIDSLLAMGLVGNSCIPTNYKWLRRLNLKVSHRPEKINLMAMRSENKRDAYWVLNNTLSWNGS